MNPELKGKLKEVLVLTLDNDANQKRLKEIERSIERNDERLNTVRQSAIQIIKDDNIKKIGIVYNSKQYLVEYDAEQDTILFTQIENIKL